MGVYLRKEKCLDKTSFSKDIPMKKRIRRFSYFASALVVLAIIAFIFRNTWLEGMGNFLIKTDPPEKVDVAVVLGGAPLARGKAAAKLYHQGFIPRLITVGATVPEVIKVLDLNTSSAELTQQVLLDEGVDSSKIFVLPLGTSTWEEAQAIVNYAQDSQYTHIMIISSNFHTRRVKWVYNKLFQDTNIEVRICGAPGIGYREDSWWNYENGLLFVNSEYLKLLYYRLVFR